MQQNNKRVSMFSQRSNSNKRFSFRGGRNRFSSNRGGSFGKPRFSQNRFAGRKMKSLPNDASLFIKKASDTTVQLEYVAKNTFESFNLAPILKENIAYKKYTIPTPIQDQAIQPILDGHDVIGLASTGTGKTAAFLIPLIQKLYLDRSQRVLIVTPTRELALQIRDEFTNFSYKMNLYSTLLIGGTNIKRQTQELQRNPSMVIATPGRLKDLINRRAIFLGNYKNIVLDEVDMMVDIGFINDVKYFISLLPKEKQSLFFSATISPKVQTVLHSFVTNPITISIPKQPTHENIDQDVVRCASPVEKINKLHDLLISDGFDKVLVFGRTKHGIEKLNKELNLRGFRVGAIHGNKNQSQRQRVLQSFKRNEIKILLATDVASRGLDIENVTHVINYELPENYDDYIHRIGRTGRANKKGVALTFLSY